MGRSLLTSINQLTSDFLSLLLHGEIPTAFLSLLPHGDVPTAFLSLLLHGEVPTAFVTTSAEVGSSPCSCRRGHRLSSHRRSTFHFSISLVLFSCTPVFNSLSIRRVYNPLSPNVCVWNCLVFCVCARKTGLRWVMSTHIVFSILSAVCLVRQNNSLLCLPNFCSPEPDSLTASYAYLTEFHTQPWSQQEQVPRL
jgi:hypothetical protein